MAPVTISEALALPPSVRIISGPSNFGVSYGLVKKLKFISLVLLLVETINFSLRNTFDILRACPNKPPGFPLKSNIRELIPFCLNESKEEINSS